MDCGNSFPPECMDFDHRPDEVKSFSIGGVNLRALPVLLEEMKKCDLVCANCHRIRTKARLKGKAKPRHLAPLDPAVVVSAAE